MDVTYTPGDGVLVGSGTRWLLLADDGVDEALIDDLWGLLAGSDTTSDTVLALVDQRCGTQHPLVLVDLTPGSETTLSRGSGRHTTLAGTHTLRLAEGPEPRRRLVAGAVAASAARLSPGLPPDPGRPPAAPTLIDGIPPEILAAVAPAPGPTTPPPAVETGDPPDQLQRRMLDRMGRTVRRDRSTVADPRPADPADADPADPDHDGHTTYRPGGPQEAPVPADVDHLQQPTHETVLAVHCPRGHVTAAYTPDCRVCHEPVGPQEPHRVPRPRLGVLHLPDGDRVPLDRGVVLGRQPAAPTASDGWPHLVRLPPGSTYVSRSHLQIELDGWLVLATDLGSRAGTTLRVPGRSPERIRAHERYVWEPGQVLDLADSYEIVYEVTS